jgi:DNA-binding transcriptional LysR family regulator
MDLNALREFSAIASEGSFAGAARRLGTPKSTVSKRIQDLEAALGVTLIERSTRKLRLTEEGALVLARADRILADADEIEGALAGQQTAVRGHLRIAVPTLFGQTFIGQVVAVSRRLHPDLTLEVVLTDSHPDPVEEGFDGAVRLGEVSDSRVVCKRLATTRRDCVAAPDLVPLPLDQPAMIAGLPVLMYGVGLIQTWYFERAGQQASVRLAGGAAMTSHLAVRDAALGGAGVALLPLYLVEQDLAAGRLVRVLDGWHAPDGEVSFVYPDALALSARLRGFIEILEQAFPNGTLHDGVLSAPHAPCP